MDRTVIAHKSHHLQGCSGSLHYRAHAPLDMDDPVAQLGRVGAVASIVAALAGESHNQSGVLAVELADQALQGVAAKAGVLRGHCRARKLLGCSGEAAVRAARHAVQPLPMYREVLERALPGPLRPFRTRCRRRLATRGALPCRSFGGRELVHAEDGMTRGTSAHCRRLRVRRTVADGMTRGTSAHCRRLRVRRTVA
jgi:hypothetical protein